MERRTSSRLDSVPLGMQIRVPQRTQLVKQARTSPEYSFAPPVWQASCERNWRELQTNQGLDEVKPPIAGLMPGRCKARDFMLPNA